MRICVDLDGVVCKLKNPGESYAELAPVEGAAEALQAMRAAGHTVILYTARHMKTCGGNVGQVVARQGKVTLDWLARHNIPYDEIYFGKPYADVYIDDNAYRFRSWQDVGPAGSRLPRSHESTISDVAP